MVRSLLLLTLLALVPFRGVQAEDFKGVAYAHTTMMEDSGIRLFCNSHFEVHWKVWTMMGEPVDEEVAAWIVPSEARFELTADFWKTCPRLLKRTDFYEQLNRTAVPAEVMKKIRIVDLLFWGFCHSPSARMPGGTPMGIRMDPGVMLRPFVASNGYANLALAELHKLASAEQEHYWSFTCPGSPDWDQLFFDRTLSSRLTAGEAKQVMKTSDLKIGLASQGGDPELEILKVSYDLSPVRNWVLDLQEKAIAQWEKESAQKESELARKDAERKKAEEKDFWNTPASTDTTADGKARQDIADARSGIAGARQSLATARQAGQKAVEAVDARIAAKRKELDLRPRPGEGPKGGLVQFSENGHFGLKDSMGKVFLPAEYEKIFQPGREDRIRVISASTRLHGFIDSKARVIVPCIYQWTEEFSEGLSEVLDKATLKRGYIDRSGRVVIPFLFDSADSFKNGYASFAFSDPLGASERFSYADTADPRNWNIRGFIDKTGTVITPPSYEYSFEFNQDGVAEVYRVIRVGSPHNLVYKSNWQLYQWFQKVSYEKYYINTKGERVSDIVHGDYDTEVKSVASPE
jgi:hypothetical protein